MGEKSIKSLIEKHADGFTQVDRQIVSVLLSDYPFAGLEPIRAFSNRAQVSAPSISRFVSKLGCARYQEFQRLLIRELKQGQRSPIDLRQDEPIDTDAPLASYLSKVNELNTKMAQMIPPAQIMRLCALIGDPKRKIYLIGGRMSNCIAEFFARNLRLIRPDVFCLPSDPEIWPEYLLRMRAQDILIVIDFRRYQASLQRLAARARAQKAQTVVITDQWISPAAKGAKELVTIPIDSGTLMDSFTPSFALVEALLVLLAEQDWQGTKERIAQWDRLRDIKSIRETERA